MYYSKKDVNILIYDVIEFARLTRLRYQVCTGLVEQLTHFAVTSVVAAAPSIHMAYNDIRPAGRQHWNRRSIAYANIRMRLTAFDF